MAASLSDRGKVLCGLVCVSAIAWMYLLAGAGMGMDAMRMPSAWTPSYAVLDFLMWSIMMIAMMLPSAAPAILRSGGVRSATFFTAGYLMVWTGFSCAATLAQWALDRAGLLSESMASRSTVVAALFLLAAGLYQLTPWKRACLEHCRSSLDCRGVRYGMSCVGCCWSLMGLLFVGGLMHLWWVAAIALWVLAERTLPWSSRMTRLSGAALIAWGSVSLTLAMV